MVVYVCVARGEVCVHGVSCVCYVYVLRIGVRRFFYLFFVFYLRPNSSFLVLQTNKQANKKITKDEVKGHTHILMGKIWYMIIMYIFSFLILSSLSLFFSFTYLSTYSPSLSLATCIMDWKYSNFRSLYWHVKDGNRVDFNFMWIESRAYIRKVYATFSAT